MLVAQVLVIAVWLGFRLTSKFEGQLWHLNREMSIPTALATAQLTLVSIVALVTAWLARARPTWHRLYLAAISLVFLVFAWDESFTLHERISHWVIYYTALGVVVIAATALVAARSPRQSWIWHICLLAGLGMSATGAVVIEHFKSAEICDNLGFWSDGRCLLYNIEESLEFLGIWLTLVAMLGQFSDAVPSPQPRARLALYILPAFVFVQLLLASPHIGELETYGREVKRELSRLALQLDYQLHFQPASVYYELDVELQAYRIEREQGTFTLQFFASIGNWRTYTGLGYSLHLVDQVTGESIVGTDASASRRHSWRITDDVWVYKQRIEIHIPSQIPTNRALWIVLTLWRNEGAEFVRQKIISSDHTLLNETQIILGELVFPAESAAFSSIPVAEFENGFTLDAIDMPERAQAGETISIPFAWRTDEEGREDHVQFLHFVHEATDAWWVFDQYPLGPRLPTRLWYSGMTDREIWEIPLLSDLAAGRYAVYTGLYRARDQERLPASDAGGTHFVDARVPLGVLTIEGA